MNILRNLLMKLYDALFATRIDLRKEVYRYGAYLYVEHIGEMKVTGKAYVEITERGH